MNELLNKISISDTEPYNKIEIRNIKYNADTEKDEGYNGNVVVAYADGYKDIFFLSINEIEDEEKVCDIIEDMFAKDNQHLNLFVYGGCSTIYNLNSN